MYRENKTEEDQDHGMGERQEPLLGSVRGPDEYEIIEGAEVTQVGPHGEMPQPVSFIAEFETITLLMKYEKVFYSLKEFAFSSVDYLESDVGVPYPFNYIVFILGSICSLYMTSILKSLMCPKKPKDTHVFNNIDSVDLSKLMKVLERIEKREGNAKQDNYVSFS